MRACRVLAVSESGYYAQHRRPPSARTIRHALLTELIRRVHLEGRATYGARRVHAELVLGQGLVVGRCAVELLMRRAGIAGASGRPQFRRIPNVATATDLVARRFGRDEPDRLWVTDITEHPTREGKVYCAVVLDVFSRRVVGWSIDATQTAALVTNALGMAIEGRRPAGTVIHSDQGTQFTSWAFTRRALDSGLMPSMGSVGSCGEELLHVQAGGEGDPLRLALHVQLELQSVPPAPIRRPSMLEPPCGRLPGAVAGRDGDLADEPPLRRGLGVLDGGREARIPPDPPAQRVVADLRRPTGRSAGVSDPQRGQDPGLASG